MGTRIVVINGVTFRMIQNYPQRHVGKPIHLLAIIVLSLICSLIFFYQRQVINEDGADYLFCAQHIYNGEWDLIFEHRPMPLVPMLIAAMYFFVVDWVIAGKLVSLLAMLFASIAFYFLVSNFFDEETAFISSLFFAVAPSFSECSALIVREPVYFLCAICFLHFFVQAVRQNRWYLNFAAFLAALLATLSRVEGILFLIVGSSYSLWALLRDKSKRRYTLVLLFLAIVLLAVAGYFYAQPIMRAGRLNDVLKIVAAPDEYYRTLAVHTIYAELKKVEKTLPGGDYRGNAIQISRRYIWLIYLISVLHQLASWSFPVMFALSLLGMYGRRGAPCYLQLWLWLFLLVPYLFLFKENFVSSRYLATASIIIYCWTGGGFLYLWHQLASRTTRVRLLKSGLLIVLLLIPFMRIVTQKHNSRSLIEVGNWLHRHYPGERVITTDARVFFYAGMHVKLQSDFVIKDNSLQQLYEQARKHRCRILVRIARREDKAFGEPVATFRGNKKNIFVYLLVKRSELRAYLQKNGYRNISQEETDVVYSNGKQKVSLGNRSVFTKTDANAICKQAGLAAVF